MVDKAFNYFSFLTSLVVHRFERIGRNRDAENSKSEVDNSLQTVRENICTSR